MNQKGVTPVLLVVVIVITMIFGLLGYYFYSSYIPQYKVNWKMKLNNLFSAQIDQSDSTLFLTVTYSTGSAHFHDGEILAIDKASQKTKWSWGYKDNLVNDATVVHNDAVYFINDYRDSVYSLNAESGLEKWVFKTVTEQENIQNLKVLESGQIYIMTSKPQGTSVYNRQSSLYKLDSTGKQIWRKDYPFNLPYSFLYDGVFYSVGNTGDEKGLEKLKVAAINTDTGDLIWLNELEKCCIYRMYVNKDSVYLLNKDSQLVLDRKSGEIKTDKRIEYDYISYLSGILTHDLNGLTLLDRNNTNKSLIYDFNQQKNIGEVEIKGHADEPIIFDNEIYITSQGENGYGCGDAFITKYNLITGSISSKKLVTDPCYDNSSPAIDSDSIYLILNSELISIKRSSI